jgi:L-ribulose-5-phosphate 3-epimerase
MMVSGIEAMEIGLMFWATGEAQTALRAVHELGIHVGQLGVPPELDCDRAVDEWKNGLQEFHLTITSAVCSYLGEQYTDLETVHKTVGFTTEGLRAERIARTKRVSDFARDLGIPGVSCHIGFIPSDPGEILYKALRDLTRALCDHCGKNGQNFVLETGQESAAVLLSFIADVDRKNLRVNFDPANMIMYGSGDPLNALKVLSRHVISVHCKDAHSPPKGSGLLGSECVLGDGEVNLPAFLKELRELGYKGALSIEREEPDEVKRLADIKTGISRLKKWKVELGLST